MRDKLKPETYWPGFIAVCDQLIAKALPRLHDNNLDYRRRMASASSLRDFSFYKFSAAYSCGYSVASLRPLFVEMMNGFFDFFEVAKEDPEYSIREYFFAYDERIRYLALAILFDADRETVNRLVKAIDFWPGKDGIWEKMIAYLGVEGREPVETIQWPAAYDNLWKCFTRHEGHAPEQLKLFVDNWYKEMDKGEIHWVDSHKNKHDTYFGYWCFEAAGVARMLNIDDSALKDHPHYPYDLVHIPLFE